MSKLNLENYFDSTKNKYYDASILVSILEKNLGKSLSEIKNDVNNAQISVTIDEIEEFLERTFQKENPGLKERIEKPKPRYNKPFDEWAEQDIKDSSQRFIDKISAGRYHFDSYTLEYFNRYTTIVRNKTLKLLNIIERIGTRQSITIQDLLVEFDIQLDENGNITREDIIRLIKPTIQNVGELDEKITKANDLSTYLTFKMSKHSLYRDGWSEGEVYPTKSIFVKDLHNGYSYGNIPISSRQEQELNEELRKSSRKLAKILTK